jgi:ABC-type multidrug transport system fused ATPase/permease subunit
MSDLKIKDYQPTPSQQRLYDLLESVFKIEQRIRFVEVDFNKPFWHIFGKYKFKLGVHIGLEILIEIYSTSLPFIISLSLASQQYQWLIYIVISYILLRTIIYFSAMLGNILVRELAGSTLVSASKFFLEVDPQFYATKSTGQIISKVNRGSGNISSLITMVGASILFILVGLFSSVGFIFSTSLLAGSIALISVGLTFFVYTFISYKFRKVFTEKAIIYSDKFTATNIETLGQLAYIRSLFASNEQFKKINTDLKQQSNSSFLTRAFNAGLFHSSNLFVSLGFLGLVLVYTNLLQTNQIGTEIALASLFSYIDNARMAGRLGNQIQELQTQIVEINDLWEFIRNFGTKNFPVLEESNDIKKVD